MHTTEQPQGVEKPQPKLERLALGIRAALQKELAAMLGIDVDYAPPPGSRNDPKNLIFVEKTLVIGRRFAELVDDDVDDSKTVREQKQKLRADLNARGNTALEPLRVQLAAEGLTYVEGQERRAA